MCDGFVLRRPRAHPEKRRKRNDGVGETVQPPTFLRMADDGSHGQSLNTPPIYVARAVRLVLVVWGPSNGVPTVRDPSLAKVDGRWQHYWVTYLSDKK